MPIKPENRKRYPKNWPEIRAEVKARADNRCELCGIQNHAIGYRHEGYFISIQQDDETAPFWMGIPQNLFRELASGKKREIKFLKIVCTVMHLDHQPENNDLKNLKFGCQKCHLNYDMKHHMANSAKTRLAAKHKQKS